jgi:two-component system, cell cycle response regulator DivK
VLPYTVAVVEDRSDNRLLLQAILSDTYHITEYESGNDVIAGLSSTLPDIVLLDISLPGIDGVGVLERIRADPRLRDLPVIALTAHTMAGDRERYLAAGFDGYVRKPIVNEADLLNTIADCIARAGRKEEPA